MQVTWLERIWQHCPDRTRHIVHHFVEEGRFINVVFQMPLFHFCQLCCFGDRIIEITETIDQPVSFCILTGQTWPRAILSICSGVE